MPNGSVQYPCFDGTPEPRGTAGEQLQPPTPWTRHCRDEQCLVQAVALREAGQWTSLSAPGKGNQTENTTKIHQGELKLKQGLYFANTM